jgi:hypothetical protein
MLLINGSLHESGGARDAEMWYLLAPHNSNTNYYKIITEAVFAKHFLKRLQLHQKELLHMRSQSPAK